MGGPPRALRALESGGFGHLHPAAAAGAARGDREGGRLVNWAQNPLLEAWSRPGLHRTGADVQHVSVLVDGKLVEAKWACTWLVDDVPRQGTGLT